MGSGSSRCPKSVEAVMKQYIHPLKTYRKLMDTLSTELDDGLSGSVHSSLKMVFTYVHHLPNGKEKGDYLALDLGGTNFRVLLINLDNKQCTMTSKIYPISFDIMNGPGEQLFDYIADCIEDLVVEQGVLEQQLPLGFTFSFPCQQTSLTEGKLISWTKGFNCSGVVDKDVVEMLQSALERNEKLKGNVGCVALLNDTVGCLMSCAFHNQQTRIGIIIGTGTNACYVEKMDRVKYFDRMNYDENCDEVLINTEWGGFGEDGCLEFVRTRLDKDVDFLSINPGRQIYEKMISGLYLGELVRRIVIRCVDLELMLDGVKTKELETPWALQTQYISAIESDELSEDYVNTHTVLDGLGYEHAPIQDCKKLHYICEIVTTRAAHLVGAGIAVLVNRVNEPNVTVAVDGSLFRFHPHFKNKMIAMSNSLISKDIKMSMMLSEDGSGKGAALVAAVAHRKAQRSRESELSKSSEPKPPADSEPPAEGT